MAAGEGEARGGTEAAAASAVRRAPRMDVRLGRLRLPNPVLTASGTFGYGLEFAGEVDLARLGGIVVKGLSLRPREGNAPPRIVETPAGMLNSIGLQNVGVDAFLAEKLPRLAPFGVPVVANLFGETVEEYAEAARRLDGAPGLAAIELNVSCPNVKKGGMVFGTDPAALAEVTAAVRRAARLPLIVKLSPNVTDIVALARAAVEGGAEILSLINTVAGMAIDARTRRPRLSTVRGGLSGPAIKPIALWHVHQVAAALPVPVIGIGGIMGWEDAVEFLLAGASAVQVGTASFVDHGAAVRVVEGLEAFLARERIESVGEIVGKLEVAKG